MAYGTDFLGPNDAGYGKNLTGAGVAPPVEPLESPPHLPLNIRFNSAQGFERRTLIPMGTAISKPVLRSLPATQAQPQDKAQSLAWAVSARLDAAVDTRWRDNKALESSLALTWYNLPTLDRAVRMVWGRSLASQISQQMVWRQAISAPKPNELPWRITQAVAIAREMTWQARQDSQIFTRLPWGIPIPPPTIVKPPQIGVPPTPIPTPPPVYVPPAGNQIGLHFNCRRGNRPGNQLRLPFRRIQCLESSFVADNTVSILRASDDLDLTSLFFNVSVRGDLDELSWSWSARAKTAILESIETGTELKLTINGQLYLVTVGEWQRSREWVDGGASDLISITGRSVSDELNITSGNRDETQTLTARQLIDQELGIGTPWTVTLHPNWVDYSVPGGEFFYQGLTALQAMAYVAEGSGAVIQHRPESRELRITPRWPIAPWNWGAAEADKELTLAMGYQIGQRKIQGRPAAGIYISGEGPNGALGQITRTGTNGDPWLESITHRLVTDGQAARQRGIAELADTGTREVETIRLPVLDETGTVMPGDLCLIIESPTEEHKALAIANEISADFTGGVTTVNQTVSVERWLGGDYATSTSTSRVSTSVYGGLRELLNLNSRAIYAQVIQTPSNGTTKLQSPDGRIYKARGTGIPVGSYALIVDGKLDRPMPAYGVQSFQV